MPFRVRPVRTAATLSVIAAASAAIIAPAASASVSSISISTSGWKPINQTTYAWGTVTGGANKTVCTQVLVNGSWNTSQCGTTNATGYYTLPLSYGSNKVGTYTFRVTSGGVTSASAQLERTSGAAPVTTKDYVKGRPTVGIPLKAGYNGVKVYLVQQALGLNSRAMDSTMSDAKTSAGENPDNLKTLTTLKAFQTKMGLPANGIVDANTFYALKDYAPKKSVLAGYNFDVDSLKQASQVKSGASRQTKINAMVAWAKSKINTPYIWGGTGPVGYDCSGFLLQALRAGGFAPTGVSNDIDIVPPSHLANALMNDSTDLVPVSLKSPLQFGDFIYYGTPGGQAGHVAMYIDNNQVISAADSLDGKSGSVRVDSLSQLFYYKAKIAVNRVR